MIVITGASDGLGLAIAKLYQESGNTVVNVSRHACSYARYNLLHNLREGNEIEQAASEIAAISEPLEALINCAGAISHQPLGQITEDKIKEAMALHIKAPMLLVSHLIDRIKQDEADIVNVVSTVATKANHDEAVYGASKWGLRGLTANLQLELKDTPCRVIGFYPGGIRTKFFTKGLDHDPTTAGNWMEPYNVAVCLKQILELPKQMEVSEIIINRK